MKYQVKSKEFQVAMQIAEHAQVEHPGPWTWDDGETMRLFDGSELHKQILKAPKKSIVFAPYYPPPQTAAFMATFNPEFVLRLMEDYLALQQEVQQLSILVMRE